MSLRAKELLDADSLEVLGDKGYYLPMCLKTCMENGIRPYVSKQNRANRTGDKDYYADKFHYDKERDIYICPAGKELSRFRARKSKSGEVMGYDYCNYEACQNCKNKARCRSVKRTNDFP